MSKKGPAGPNRAWFDAIRQGGLDRVQELLRHQPDLLSSRTPEGLTPLLLAVEVSQHDVADYLFDETPEPDIFEATVFGQLERIEELCAADAKLVNARLADGRTPLHLAAIHDQVAIARHLLSHGADATAKDNAGKTPLTLAKDHPAVMDILSKANAPG